MHVPDGFLSPHTYLPATAVAATFWAVGVRRLRRELDAETLPYLAACAALSFVLMSVALPLPGGVTAHATGVGLLAVSFGGWMSFLALSVVLAMQALLFGSGGVTALPVNALALGLVGSFSARLVWQLAARLPAAVGLFLAGWIAVVVPALLLAVVLGIQPEIASDERGTPLFFPFGLAVTLPAVVLPHLLLGVAEGALTVLGHRYLTRLRARTG